MKVKKSDICSALAQVMPICSRRSTLPACNCVLLSATCNTLVVRATSLDSFQTVAIPCEGDLPQVMVLAKKLDMALANAADDVTITAAEGFITISGGVKAKLPTLDPATFPGVEFGAMTAIGIPCLDLAEGIKAVSWAASENDPTSSFKQCFEIEAKPRELIVRACDGKTAGVFRRALACAEMKAMIHLSFEQSLALGLQKEESRLMKGESWIGVTYKDGSFFCRISEGCYPESLQHRIPDPEPPLGSVNVPALLSHVKGCMLAADDEKWVAVTLDFDSDGLIVRAESSATGTNYEGVVPGVFDPGKAKIGVNHLKDALQSCSGETVRPWLPAKLPHTFAWQDGDTTVLIAGIL